MIESQDKAVELFYEQSGRGFPVFLIHGYPLDHTIWRRVIPLVKSEARIITPDLRGFGQSPVPEGVYTMQLMAEDLARLMDRLEIQRAALIGHSMGGYVTLAFAAAFPDRLAGIGLVASQAAADSQEARQNRYKTAAQVAVHGVQLVADAMPAKLTADPEVQAEIRTIILHTRPEGIIGALKGMAERIDSTPNLPIITPPGLVIAGAEDKAVPVERSREMAGMLPRTRLVVLDGAGHMPMLEKPEQVAAELDQFITDVKAIEAASG